MPQIGKIGKLLRKRLDLGVVEFTRCVFRGLRLNRNYSYLYIHIYIRYIYILPLFSDGVNLLCTVYIYTLYIIDWHRRWTEGGMTDCPGIQTVGERMYMVRLGTEQTWHIVPLGVLEGERQAIPGARWRTSRGPRGPTDLKRRCRGCLEGDNGRRRREEDTARGTSEIHLDRGVCRHMSCGPKDSFFLFQQLWWTDFSCRQEMANYTSLYTVRITGTVR